MPLRCSFLGKVPPIGGFRVLYNFLPPTLLRGGICAFWTSAILRRNGPVSDFISCSGLYRRKGIFHRCVDENIFRTDPHICRAVTSHRIFFTLSQLQQRQVRKGVNGGFKHTEGFAAGAKGNGKGKPLIAAGDFTGEGGF